MSFYLPNQFFILMIDFIGIYLAFWVYLNNKKDKVNQLFFLMTFFILLWINFYYLFDLLISPSLSLLWIRLAAGSVSLFLISFYFFFLYFFNTAERIPKILNKIILIIGLLFFVLLSSTNLLIKGVEIKEWGVDLILSQGTIFFYFFVIFLSFFIIFLFSKSYFKLLEKDKTKVQYFLIGVFIWIAANFIFNVFLPLVQKSIRYHQIGDYSAIFLLGFTAYAIVKQKLFGIKVILVEFLVVMMGLILLIRTLTEPDVPSRILGFLVFFVFCGLGYFLIRAVYKEIEDKEKFEKLSEELKISYYRLDVALTELEKSYYELKRIDTAKSEFISMASHQLRTPLTVIKCCASMLLEGSYGKMPSEAIRIINNIFSSNERLIKIVSDLLDISKMELGRMELRTEEVQISDLIENICQEIKIEADKKKLFIKFEKPEVALPKIKVDAFRIKEVLSNIIENAIKYTLKGGVVVMATAVNSKLRIEISDTGEGLTKEEISKMFESFSRGAAGTRLWTEGVGLGLYISKKFIEMHKGKIWAQSEGRGKGSRFFIELPIEGGKEK